MTFRKRLTAQTLNTIGLVCLLLFFLTSRVQSTTDFRQGVIDGARGVVFGIAAASILKAVWLTGRQRRGF